MHINIDELVDLRDMAIDASLPVPEKREALFNQIGESGCCRYEDTIVRFTFPKTEATFGDRVKQYLLSGQGMSLMPR